MANQCLPQCDDPWLGRDFAGHLLYGAVAFGVTQLYDVWKNYRDFSRNAPGLYVKLRNMVGIIEDMKVISHNTAFNAALTKIEQDDLEKYVDQLDNTSIVLRRQIEPFQSRSSSTSYLPKLC
jgi:hypothetical protein